MWKSLYNQICNEYLKNTEYAKYNHVEYVKYVKYANKYAINIYNKMCKRNAWYTKIAIKYADENV
jgi:hypothetical protein